MVKSSRYAGRCAFNFEEKLSSQREDVCRYSRSTNYCAQRCFQLHHYVLLIIPGGLDSHIESSVCCAIKLFTHTVHFTVPVI
jgi:hypothetical protein